ncbi:MAG: hypothetical protein ACRDGJ_12390 [Candidatus Limnocylindria bacterium]
MDSFGEAPAVRVDVYTAAYRVSGTLRTRFSRVADMVNQLSTTHLLIEQATVSEFDDATATLSAQQAYVAVDEILLLAAPELHAESHPEMTIAKRAVRAQLAIPPFRLTGHLHVPQGSRPMDGLLNVSERYIPITDASITSAAHPELSRSVAALAVRRDRAHVLLVADDERPDELLADVIDERTAEAWLRSPSEEGGRHPV